MWILNGVIVVGVLLLTGCQGDRETSPGSGPSPRTASNAVLEDRHVQEMSAMDGRSVEEVMMTLVELAQSKGMNPSRLAEALDERVNLHCRESCRVAAK